MDDDRLDDDRDVSNDRILDDLSGDDAARSSAPDDDESNELSPENQRRSDTFGEVLDSGEFDDILEQDENGEYTEESIERYRQAVEEETERRIAAVDSQAADGEASEEEAKEEDEEEGEEEGEEFEVPDVVIPNVQLELEGGVVEIPGWDEVENTDEVELADGDGEELPEWVTLDEDSGELSVEKPDDFEGELEIFIELPSGNSFVITVD